MNHGPARKRIYSEALNEIVTTNFTATMCEQMRRKCSYRFQSESEYIRELACRDLGIPESVSRERGIKTMSGNVLRSRIQKMLVQRDEARLLARRYARELVKLGIDIEPLSLNIHKRGRKKRQAPIAF